jgi:hypothetical protein
VLGVAVGEGADPGHAVQLDLGDPWDPGVDVGEVAQDLPGGVRVGGDLDCLGEARQRALLPALSWRTV